MRTCPELLYAQAGNFCQENRIHFKIKSIKICMALAQRNKSKIKSNEFFFTPIEFDHRLGFLAARLILTMSCIF